MFISAIRHKSKFNFQLSSKFLGFHVVVLVKTSSIDVSITNVGLILTKLRWFQFFGKSQNSNFELFWRKKNQFFGFLWCSTRKDISIDASISNVGLILRSQGDFIFSGYGQTDRQGFGILIWKYVGSQKFQLKAQNYWLAVYPYMPPQWTGIHKKKG